MVPPMIGQSRPLLANRPWAEREAIRGVADRDTLAAGRPGRLARDWSADTALTGLIMEVRQNTSHDLERDIGQNQRRAEGLCLFSMIPPTIVR